MQSIILTLYFFLIYESRAQEDIVKVTPLNYVGALNNPLKGFRYGVNEIGKYPYDAITREYLKWNELERNANDGIERILQVCNNNWKNLAQNNSIVIPRVYLDWDSKTGNEYWPSDMKTGDYYSDLFKQPVEQLVKKLGQAWDNDPGVAWIQLGIIGYWGEHYSPSLNDWQQKLLGDLFTKYLNP